MFSAPTSSISSLKQIAFQACANHYGNDAFAFFSKELDQLEDNFEESNSDHEESKAEKLISFAQENRGIVSELVFIEQACKAVRQLNPNKRKKTANSSRAAKDSKPNQNKAKKSAQQPTNSTTTGSLRQIWPP